MIKIPFTIPKSFLPWLRRIGWMAVWLVTLFVLGTVIENWRGNRAWQAYQDEAKARGDRLDLETVIPPPVPDAENFASAPLFKPLYDFTREGSPIGEVHWRDPEAKAALDQIDPLGPTKQQTNSQTKPQTWRHGHAMDLAAWQSFYRDRSDFPKNPQPQSAGEDILLALSKFDPFYSQLREACQRPQSRFPVRYEDNVSTRLPHLGVLRQLAKIASLRAVAELSLQQNDRAFEDTGIALRLTESISTEPILISILVQIAMQDLAMQPIWEGLTQHRWNEAQLAELDTRLAKFNHARSMANGIRGERNLFTVPVMDILKSNPQILYSPKSDGNSEGNLGSLFPLMPSGWFQQNKVTMCLMDDAMRQTIDPEARRFFPDRAEQMEKQMERLPRGWGHPYTCFASYAQPALLNAEVRCAAQQGSIDLARIAIALERHRLKHEKYPPSLEALDATCDPGGIPADCATGRPPHYRCTDGETYSLYYEGWNQVDDGGKAVLKGSGNTIDLQQGDWVWFRAGELSKKPASGN